MVSPMRALNFAVVIQLALCALHTRHDNAQSANVSQAPRPNFVLLLADDLGYGDLGCYGHERVSTPNIDGLARDGLRFTRMYSQPVCTPSRASVLTGRYPARYGMTKDRTLIQYPFKNPVFLSHSLPGGIPSVERPVLSDMLASLGYRTAMIGKWHLGSGYRGEHLPLNYGFNFFYGVPDSHSSGCTRDLRFRKTDADIFLLRLEKYKGKLTALAVLLLTMWYTGYAGKKTMASVILLTVSALFIQRIYLSFLLFNPKSCILMQNNTILEQPYNENLMAPRTTQKALEFISTSATGSQPFFLFMSYLQVHLPPILSERFRNRSGIGLYYDSVIEMDWSVGKIVNLLKQLDLYNNTLIIFSSDNGPELEDPFSGAARELSLRGSTIYTMRQSQERIHLRGGKQHVWEGGIRVPAIFVWPGVIGPGTESHQVASLMDIYPTICEIVQEKFPTRFDGKSLLQILNNANSSSPHRFLMHYCDNGGVSAVTANRYKVHFRSCREEIFYPPLLFDIENDPGESKPLDVAKYKSLMVMIDNEVQRHETSVSPVRSLFSQIPRPWFYLCSNPPYCQQSFEDEENFD